MILVIYCKQQIDYDYFFCQDEGGGSSVAMEMWISMLCNHSSSERCPGIQLACAAVIRQNARILLYNPAQCLGITEVILLHK